MDKLEYKKEQSSNASNDLVKKDGAISTESQLIRHSEAASTDLTHSVKELTTVIKSDRDSRQVEVAKANDESKKGAIKWLSRKTVGHVKNHTSRHFGKEFKSEGLRFAQITKEDISHLDQVAIEAKKQVWLEELRVPFRMTMRELGVYSDDIDKRLNGLLIAHALCSANFLTVFYLLLSSLIAIILGGGSVTYSLSMFIYLGVTSVLWLMYSYHCWTFRNDRYGTLNDFIYDLKSGALSIYFPYHPDSQEYHSEVNFSEFYREDESVE